MSSILYLFSSSFCLLLVYFSLLFLFSWACWSSYFNCIDFCSHLYSLPSTSFQLVFFTFASLLVPQSNPARVPIDLHWCCLRGGKGFPLAIVPLYHYESLWGRRKKASLGGSGCVTHTSRRERSLKTISKGSSSLG